MSDTNDRLRRLEDHVGELSGDLRVLRALVARDHGSALNKIRFVTEKVLHRLCVEHDVSWGSSEPTLENMIGPLISRKVIPKNVAIHVRTVQTNASPGSHFQETPLDTTHVNVAQMALLDFLEWSYRTDGVPAGPTLLQPSPTTRSRIVALTLVALVVVAAVGAGGLLLRQPRSATVTRQQGIAVTRPEPTMRQPLAGLRAIDTFRDPKGAEVTTLESAQWWQSAARDFDEAAAQHGAPLRWRAAHQFCVGQMLARQGKPSEAARALEAATKLEPSWAVAWAGLAVALGHWGQTNEAVRAAQKAQQLEPTWWGAVSAEARAYSAAGRLDEAIQTYRRALVMAPHEPLLLAELAQVFFAARLDSEAERYAKLALDADPDMFGAHLLLAERALEHSDGKTALGEATRAVSVSPTSVSARLAMADALALLGRKPVAMEAYQHALSLAPLGGSGSLRLDEARAAVAHGVLPPPRVVDASGAKQAHLPTSPLPHRTSACGDPNDPLCGSSL